MRKADFVVDVREYCGENVDDAMLESLGFETMDVNSIDPDCYRIWRRTNRLLTTVGPIFRALVEPSDRGQRSVR
jgi:hypothetical protein